MPPNPKQIHEGLEHAKQCLKECIHPVVFYNCDDVGYPSGWVETWACLVCGRYDHHSTGRHGHCLGEFGNREFTKTQIIILVNNRFCKHYSENPYQSFDALFEEIQNSLKGEGHWTIYIRKGEKSKKVIVNQKTTASELKELFSIIHRIL